MCDDLDGRHHQSRGLRFAQYRSEWCMAQTARSLYQTVNAVGLWVIVINIYLYPDKTRKTKLLLKRICSFQSKMCNYVTLNFD